MFNKHQTRLKNYSFIGIHFNLLFSVSFCYVSLLLWHSLTGTCVVVTFLYHTVVSITFSTKQRRLRSFACPCFLSNATSACCTARTPGAPLSPTTVCEKKKVAMMDLQSSLDYNHQTSIFLLNPQRKIYIDISDIIKTCLLENNMKSFVWYVFVHS